MTSQHGAHALYAGLARLHAPMRNYTPTRPGNHTHARARMHIQTSNTYCFSTVTVRSSSTAGYLVSRLDWSVITSNFLIAAVFESVYLQCVAYNVYTV
jgi:hypothetical protein